MSNTSGVKGAVCILYEGVLKDFADKLGSDLLIIPSSIHETLLILYDKDADLQELAEMVTSGNESEVMEDEVLSDHVYCYTREDNLLTIVS